jgi:uncharacterized protein YdaU (DUF1376 family)
MPKGDYYFKLYYQRLLTSTVGWKDDEFGAYMRLLIYQFDKGSIPSEISQISRIAPSAKKHWPLLSQKFVPDGNGGLVNKVMDEVRSERITKSKTMAEVGRGGGRPKINQKVSENKPNGSENKSNTNVSTGILVIGSGKERGGGEEKPLGSDAVSTFANEAWQDQKWRENMMMGLNIKNEDTFKRWMAQFNASVANDPFPDFSTSKYKKLSRGWIAKQIERGAQIPEGSHIQTSTRLPQKI